MFLPSRTAGEHCVFFFNLYNYTLEHARDSFFSILYFREGYIRYLPLLQGRCDPFRRSYAKRDRTADMKGGEEIMQIVTILIVGILALFGLVDVIRRIVLELYNPEGQYTFHVVVMLENPDECEYLIKSCAERLQWMSPHYDSRLICVNTTGNEEIDMICELMKNTYPYLVVSKLGDLEYNILQH